MGGLDACIRVVKTKPPMLMGKITRISEEKIQFRYGTVHIFRYVKKPQKLPPLET